MRLKEEGSGCASRRREVATPQTEGGGISAQKPAKGGRGGRLLKWPPGGGAPRKQRGPVVLKQLWEEMQRGRDVGQAARPSLGIG